MGQQFYMVFTLINYRNDVMMFKLNRKYEPQAIEWFHRKVLNLFDVIFMVNKNTDHRKLLSICHGLHSY